MSGDRNSKLLKNSIGVSLATLASRIMGLVRVRLESYALGGGNTASVWFLTLMIPNLLRRLLGEGALGNALIPLIAETEYNDGISAARRGLAQVLILLGMILALISGLVSTTAMITGDLLPDSDTLGMQGRLAGICELLPIMMPYAFFICLTGVIGAVLNYAEIFVRPALTALLFNIFMIVGLSIGINCDLEAEKLLTLLAFLTPASGAVQMILLLWMLRSCGKFPVFSRDVFKDLTIFKRVMKLAAPGIIGYGMLQISFLVDRSLALYLGEKAVPALTYVDRIIDLPIGLFAVSLGSVLMASMTHAAANSDFRSMQEQLNFSMRHVWFICGPMAAAVIFFHAEILQVLCLGGKYTMDDLDAARSVAIFYGMGIPFFCTLKVVLPAFYSRKDMKRPLYVSTIAISVNIILNLILMFPLEQGGLALATVIASILNNFLLLRFLNRDGINLSGKTLLSCVRSVVIACAAAAAVKYFVPCIAAVCRNMFLPQLWVLILTGICFGIIFFVAAIIVKMPEVGEFFAILKRKKRSSDENSCGRC